MAQNEASAQTQARTAYIFARLVGHALSIRLSTGEALTGILHAIDQQTLAVTVTNALVAGRPPAAQLVLAASTIVSFSTAMSPNPPTAPPNSHLQFKKDSDISKASGIKERILTKWSPPEDSSPSSFLSLESNKGKKWDQFDTNQRLFGVQTDYDESLYTTTLDKTAPDFKQKEAEAARIAAEIESSFSANPHLAEERNQSVSSLDEEERYSSVVRNPNKYAPPQLRKSKKQPASRYPHTSYASAASRPPIARSPSQQSSQGSSQQPAAQSPQAASANTASPQQQSPSAPSTKTSAKPPTNAWSNNTQKTTHPNASTKESSANIANQPNAPQNANQTNANSHGQITVSTSKMLQGQQSIAPPSTAPVEPPNQQIPPTQTPAVSATSANPDCLKTRGVPPSFASILQKASASGNIHPAQPPIIEKVAESFKQFAGDQHKRHAEITQNKMETTIADLKNFSTTFKIPTFNQNDAPKSQDAAKSQESSKQTAKESRGNDQKQTAKASPEPAISEPAPAAARSASQQSASSSKTTQSTQEPTKKHQKTQSQTRNVPPKPQATAAPKAASVTSSETKPAKPVVFTDTDRTDVISITSDAESTATNITSASKSTFKFNVAAAEFTPSAFTPTSGKPHHDPKPHYTQKRGAKSGMHSTRPHSYHTNPSANQLGAGPHPSAAASANKPHHSKASSPTLQPYAYEDQYQPMMDPQYGAAYMYPPQPYGFRPPMMPMGRPGYPPQGPVPNMTVPPGTPGYIPAYPPQGFVPGPMPIPPGAVYGPPPQMMVPPNVRNPRMPYGPGQPVYTSAPMMPAGTATYSPEMMAMYPPPPNGSPHMGAWIPDPSGHGMMMIPDPAMSGMPAGAIMGDGMEIMQGMHMMPGHPMHPVNMDQQSPVSANSHDTAGQGSSNA